VAHCTFQVGFNIVSQINALTDYVLCPIVDASFTLRQDNVIVYTLSQGATKRRSITLLWKCL